MAILGITNLKNIILDIKMGRYNAVRMDLRKAIYENRELEQHCRKLTLLSMRQDTILGQLSDALNRQKLGGVIPQLVKKAEENLVNMQKLTALIYKE